MLKSNNLPFKLFSNCIPVLGKKRSVICDFQKNDIKIIPNDLYNILIEHEEKTIENIKSNYNNQFDDVIDEYFQFLVENDFIFFTKTPQLFPKIDTTWRSPFQISNAIIDFNNESQDNFDLIFNQLDDLRCKHIQIRFFSETTIDLLNRLITYLNDNKSIIQNVEIYLPFTNSIKHEDLLSFIESNGRLSTLIVYEAEKDDMIMIKHQGYLLYIKDKLHNEKSCGKIHSGNFVKNITNYIESVNHNSCLNGKISVDVNGNIKNCPSMHKSFGNIKETSLKEALSHTDFKQYWNITKDQIDGCKDCEFRHVCTDCRAYVEDPKNDYSKPLKCGYDPETNKWSDWSTNPLKEKGINHYGLTELLNNK